jgi:hypothetical protein
MGLAAYFLGGSTSGGYNQYVPLIAMFGALAVLLIAIYLIGVV